MAKTYTVQQVSKLSGVSVRTLHYYDHIGLLVPAQVGANGYRYYGHAELLRLQQILFYREVGMPLKQIGPLLHDSSPKRIAALEACRAQLAQAMQRHALMLETIDRTIASLTGGYAMEHQELYAGLSPSEAARLKAQAVDLYGAEPVETAGRTWEALGQAGREQRMQELGDIEAALADACRAGVPPDAAHLDPILARHRAWVAAMWSRPCERKAYAGLAATYRHSPEFRARFESLAPGLTDYLASAMECHAARA